jgi:Na+/H+-dicarboxylate symporter
MQIYTKVLIGMVVGAAVGICLGPKSEFLTKDTYKVHDASQVAIYRDRDDPETRVSLPEGVSLDFQALEIVRAELEDSVGRRHTVPTWAHVRFRFTQELGLNDTDGAVREQLGDPEPMSWVTVWLEIENIALPSGGFTSVPEPISGLGDKIVSFVRPVGTAFMRLITMVIVPLVFSSLLVGVASLGDVRKLGRLGGKTIGLYLTTTAIAVSIGLACAHLIKPGNFVGEADRAALQAQFSGDASTRAEDAANAPSTIDNILNIIPNNPVDSLASGNMLQIIFFAVVFGIALTLLEGDKGTQIVSFFDRVQEAMVVVIHIVMALAPYGVAALVADVVGQSGVSVLSALLVYAVTVIVGLSLQTLLVYGGIVRFIARLKIIPFMKAVRPAQLIAFSTSSSSATLPVSMECAEENLGISNAVSSFVLPLGSTVNMDGTALYQGVAAIFIAQVFQVDLSIGDQLAIVASATLASVGAAGVPGAGIVTLAMVLTASGIPAVGIALILGMDRLLDMFRTAVNVTGDLAVASAMATAEGETIEVLTSEEDKRDPDRGFERRLERDEHPVPPEE